MNPLPGVLRLETRFHERVWGGQRIKSHDPPIGEAWLVFEDNLITGDAFPGQTLADLAAQYGEALIGRRATPGTGDRFPLLIKLLDTADWLSIQVHPDDEAAARLEGPGFSGKTEAWHILHAAPGARLITGFNQVLANDALAAAIREGSISDHARYTPVSRGDTLFIPARTLHALGPGLLVYEVQQTSDLTYRVFDWNRPSTAGREIHIDQSLAVLDPTSRGDIRSLSARGSNLHERLLECAYFVLELLGSGQEPVRLDTAGASFHALTVIEGQTTLSAAGTEEMLALWDTAVVPACIGSYELRSEGGFKALKASIA